MWEADCNGNIEDAWVCVTVTDNDTRCHHCQMTEHFSGCGDTNDADNCLGGRDGPRLLMPVSRTFMRPTAGDLTSESPV